MYRRYSAQNAGLLLEHLNDLPARLVTLATSRTAGQGQRVTSTDPLGPPDSGPRRVVAVLRRRGPLSRAQIAQETGLSRGTVATVLAALVERGIACEAPDRVRSGSLGRPAALVRLDRRAGLAAGVDIGKQHIRVAVADLGQQVLAEQHLEVPVDLPAAEGVATAVALLDTALAEAAADRAELIGVGVALPGPLHAASGELGSSTIMPGWAGVRPRELLEQQLRAPVRFDNDANLGALAEWTWGAARGYADVAYLKLATGIGCGLIANGRPLYGAGGTAGELGHLLAVRDGPPCRCGNRGCLETVAGGPAVVEAVRQAHGTLTVPEIIQRAAAGDMACRAALQVTGELIGQVASALVNLINPALLVVGGPLAAAGEPLLNALRQGIGASAVGTAMSDLTIVPSQLQERAEVLGGVASVMLDLTLGPRLSRPDLIA